MGSQQDFRSLQARFQASQPQPSEHPRKPPKPDFNRLKRFPPPEPSEHPRKPPQPKFANPPRKPPQPEFTDPPRKPPQPEFTDPPRKPPQPEFTDPPRKPPQPEFADPPRKPPQPEFADPPRKPPQPEFTDPPRKPPQPEFADPPRKPPQPEFADPPRKPPQPEFADPPRKPPQPEFSDVSKKFSQLDRKSPQPKVGESPLRSSQPEPINPARPLSEPKFSTFPKKPPQPQVTSLPPKQRPQPKVSGVPPTQEAHEPRPRSPRPDFFTLPKKPPQPGLGELSRTSSEPEVSVLPKRPPQPELRVPSTKPPQPRLDSLSRTSSEPEFCSLPRKSLQPPRPGGPRKLSQPEPSAASRQHLQPDFLTALPRKPALPGSVSESSLPTAIAGSRPQFPLSPGFGVPGIPRWGSEDLTHKGGSRSGLRASHPPRRRPLPPASSLGPPPAKPPLPPGPMDIQSFRRPSAAATDLQRTGSPAGTPFRADTKPEPEYIYELYDNVEPADLADLGGPGPRPSHRPATPAAVPLGDTSPTQTAARRPPADGALREERAPQSHVSLPTDPKLLKQIRKAEKAEKEFRKKFKFEGEIVVHTRMMIDPNAKTRRGGGRHLGIRRGEILEVIEFTSQEEMLCRNPKGKYGYVPRTALLPLETEVYDDVGVWDPLESHPFLRGQ
ncbi:PML-RARA-regulated adapter molecule 1 [Lepus europaeus]|uniref:PML-RARA-regulated adapter molecule 1 n=1 Tax=Lepus europaeus TaxID=9983 RepID=UPI002B49C060|nr:PML-RARA-regulated adapter molecule 1 [Lepus europaeus]